MQMKQSRKNIITCILLFVLCILSVAGIWKTVYYSADIDESYALTMAVRIISGDRMVIDMWEPHQMSAVLYAPLVACYKGITGSMEGALVFMRWCGVLIQAGISLFLYCTVRRQMPAQLAMILSFAYFNFTPKHIQSPEFSVLFYWGSMLLMLFLLRFGQDKRLRNIVAAGCCMSGIVLCYPATVFLFLYLAAWLFWKKEKKAAGVLTLVCGLCGAVFVLWLVIAGSGAVFENIPYILMDESHKQNLWQHIRANISELWDMLWIVFAFVVLCHVGRPVLGRKGKRDKMFFGLLMLCMAGYALFLFHTINDVNFMIFYPVIPGLLVVEWYAYASFPKDETDRLFFGISFPVGVIGVAAIMVSSNLTAQYSVSYLMPAVILGAWQIYRVYAVPACDDELPAHPESSSGRSSCRVMAMVLLVCIMAQLFAVRIFLVRFTATQRKNILEPYYEVTHDVLKGIRLGEFDYIQYETKTRLLSKYVGEDDVLLYVGADMFLYSSLDSGGIGTGNTISTPSFGQQLIEYYEKHPERKPTVVFVDREYGADFSVLLTQEPLKTFMETEFDMSQAIVEQAVTVYQKQN